MSDAAALAGRVLLAGLLLLGAAQKLADPAPVQALLAMRGWPLWLIWPALGFNAIAGAALLAGIAVRPLALMAAGYCMVTSWFHFLPDDPWQMSIFVKNWSVAGGFLLLAAHGPGRFAPGRG